MHANFPLLLTFTAALLVAMLPASRGRAQTFTAPLVLDVSAPEPPPPRWLATGPADLTPYEAAKRQRRSRLILAAGLGLLLGASIHIAAMAPRRHCNEGTSDAHTLDNSLYAAGFFGAVGLGLAIGGGTRLAIDAREHWSKPSAAQRLLAAGAGAAGAAIAATVPVLVWGLDTVGCSS
jgi:hypothetical protein